MMLERAPKITTFNMHCSLRSKKNSHLNDFEFQFLKASTDMIRFAHKIIYFNKLISRLRKTKLASLALGLIVSPYGRMIILCFLIFIQPTKNKQTSKNYN